MKSTFYLLFNVLFVSWVNAAQNSELQMPCVSASWNATSECVQVTNLTPACSPVISSLTEWRVNGGSYAPVPASGNICGCNVYEYLDVTPVCQVSGSSFVLGGTNFNRCPGRCLSRADFTFPQGNTNVVDFPACSQNINCITITPTQLLANGGSMTAYYRSDTEFGAVVTILRFTYNGQGLGCQNINTQVIQRGKIYKDITIRRTVQCSGGTTEICETTVDIPQLPDECLLEGFINTVNVGSPCNTHGFSASTINLQSGGSYLTYQWTYNGVNISQNYAPHIYCMAGRPNGIYCAKISDASGCMVEPCRIFQTNCTLGAVLTLSGQHIYTDMTNCTGSPSYQWSKWSPTGWQGIPGAIASSYNTGRINGEYRVLITCGSCMTFANIIISTFEAPLPIAMPHFDIIQEKECGAIKVTWSTSLEKNSAMFAVQRSENGQDFKDIQEISSKNLSHGSSYEISDADPLIHGNQYYYRIVHTDFDGSKEYYSVKALAYSCTESEFDFKISPNPADQFITISLPKSDFEYQINIKSIDGSLLQTKTYQKHSIELSFKIHDLLPGTYFVEVVSKHNNGIRQKVFVKI